MPAPPRIRDAAPADRPAVTALFRALQAHEITLEPNRAPPEATDPHVAFLLAWAAEGGCVLIAEDPATHAPLGLLIAGIEDDGAYVLPENRRVAKVSDLVVAPEARRRGLARALLAAAEDRFRAMGVRRMEISSLAANPEARALYEAWSGRGPNFVTYAKSL